MRSDPPGGTFLDGSDVFAFRILINLVVSTRPVRFPPVRKENAVNPVVGGLTRWAPRPAGGFRRRRRPGRVRGHPRGRPGGVPRGWRITLVARVNNFWGLLHRGGHLRVGVSAGRFPGVSKTSPTAAVEVARVVAQEYHRGTPGGTPRGKRPRYDWGTRRWRGLTPGEGPRRRPRRWRHPTRRGPRVGVTPVVVSLVGWSRDRRWRFAWGALELTGRVAVVVVPVRPHNGLRGKKPRRT